MTTLGSVTMPENEENRPEGRTEDEGSDTSSIVELYRSFLDHNKEDGGAAMRHNIISVWAGILLLAGMLAFGFFQIKGWVQDVREKLEHVSQDNKLLLEGLDELLARADQDRVAETESSTPAQTARTRSQGEKDLGDNLSKRYKIYYRTKKGEGLFQISRKFEVSVDELRLWNTLEPTDPVIPGQVLVINKSTRPDKPTVVARASSPPPDGRSMVAKREKPAVEETAGRALAGADRQPRTEPEQEEPVPDSTPVDKTASEKMATTSTPAESKRTTAERAEAVADEPVGEIPGQPVQEPVQKEPVPDSTSVDKTASEKTVATSTPTESEKTTAERAEAVADEPVGEIPDESVEEIVHTVQPGETLSDIAQEYGVPWETVAAYNGITRPETLYEGQAIRIPLDGEPIETKSMAMITHTVQEGENLYRIGLKYGVSWEVIARENNITDSRALLKGQVLKIPAGRGGPEF
jgi:LysM repeat protein